MYELTPWINQSTLNVGVRTWRGLRGFICHTYIVHVGSEYLNFNHNWRYLSSTERKSGPFFKIVEDQEQAKDQNDTETLKCAVTHGNQIRLFQKFDFDDLFNNSHQKGRIRTADFG